MDFRFTTEQEAFRQEIRAFVRTALPEPPDILEDAWIVGFDRVFSKFARNASTFPGRKPTLQTRPL